ncbi:MULTISPECIES: YdcF family protein [unclassified Exiguobacterium]|uniref:YdcF family protein n=1 Tax=unclassified Exiguobacterium TaxID=2644629 RepID=UPI00103E271F|nr:MULTISPECIES: YdcF family protein [unclassified Exiguobacterium]TCI39162.1 YdcF family protein [Exiguobacterium sp. SH4S7]TCI48151.1 YdcF family protein [Exiguobacterium sp. SH5S32]TCI55038.1 YdcF family protein [Exiguobacterium sp. SH1S4]TCI63048.1 YdcF family protein [Exiguobacterium sp. SH0S2]TCI74830.1 YdcF family protein [Exiguobacterium sp. SH1S1]
MRRHQADGTYRYVLILGAKVNGTAPSRALRNRIDVAATYAHQYPHVKLIASGGQGPDEGMAEGRVIARELIDRGVDPGRIHIEADSTSTYENFLFSRDVWAGETGLTVVTNDFHVRRARLVGRLYFGLKTDALYAPTPAAAKAKYVIREQLAYIKLLINYMRWKWRP